MPSFIHLTSNSTKMPTKDRSGHRYVHISCLCTFVRDVLNFYRLFLLYVQDLTLILPPCTAHRHPFSLYSLCTLAKCFRVSKRVSSFIISPVQSNECHLIKHRNEGGLRSCWRLYNTWWRVFNIDHPCTEFWQ